MIKTLGLLTKHYFSHFLGTDVRCQVLFLQMYVGNNNTSLEVLFIDLFIFDKLIRELLFNTKYAVRYGEKRVHSGVY